MRCRNSITFRHTLSVPGTPTLANSESKRSGEHKKCGKGLWKSIHSMRILILYCCQRSITTIRWWVLILINSSDKIKRSSNSWNRESLKLWLSKNFSLVARNLNQNDHHLNNQKELTSEIHINRNSKRGLTFYLLVRLICLNWSSESILAHFFQIQFFLGRLGWGIRSGAFSMW